MSSEELWCDACGARCLNLNKYCVSSGNRKGDRIEICDFCHTSMPSSFVEGTSKDLDYSCLRAAGLVANYLERRLNVNEDTA